MIKEELTEHRRRWSLDVGNTTKETAQEYVNKIMEAHREKMRDTEARIAGARPLSDSWLNSSTLERNGVRKF